MPDNLTPEGIAEKHVPLDYYPASRLGRIERLTADIRTLVAQAVEAQKERDAKVAARWFAGYEGDYFSPADAIRGGK